MQIPEHWAEARIVGKVNGKDRVVRRFGWSDISAADAQRHAEERAAAAMAELQAGHDVPRREQKLKYGGQGLPIREEVLARHGDLVITRNSYGAHCLNEPDVLFADVDVAPRVRGVGTAGCATLAVVFALTVAAVVWLGVQQRPLASMITFAAGTAIVIFLAVPGNVSVEKLARDRAERLERVRAAVAAEGGARAALYETPSGWRVLLLHRRFDPTGAEARRWFAVFDTDKAYVQMCQLQACFRARVSGKPWRMGLHVHMRPRPGVWPVHPDRLAIREEWVRDYETLAPRFAACRFVEDLGIGPVDPRCAEVQRVHDELSRARTDLPIA